MTQQWEGRNWSIANADCIEAMAQMPENSIDHSCFSSPFHSLYTYSSDGKDLSNCVSLAEFKEHHAHFARALFDVMKPGTVICDHLKDITQYMGASDNGEGGLAPIMPTCLMNYIDAGFSYHCLITIRRCPQEERRKNNPLRLTYKTLGINSRAAGVALPEYIVVMRKDNRGYGVGDPVKHAIEKHNLPPVMDQAAAIAKEDAQRMLVRGMIDGISDELTDWLLDRAIIPKDKWIEWAEPVWMKTNNKDVAHNRFYKNRFKAEKDERHLTPMPLDLIERCLTLYSSPGDVVFDPFSGIGSTGYMSVKMARKFFGTELKPEYAAQAAKVIEEAANESRSLFDI